MTEKKNVTLSLAGFLPSVLAWILLGSIGWCGNSCQTCTNEGIAEFRKAATGE